MFALFLLIDNPSHEGLLITFIITGTSNVCLAVCSSSQQRKYQRSIELALCEGQPPVTGGLSSQSASNAEIVYHHDPDPDHTLQWRHNELAGVLKSPASRLFTRPFIHEDQRKHQSSASLAFVWGIHRWPMNSPQKGPVTRKMFPFDDVIMVMSFSEPKVCKVGRIHWLKDKALQQSVRLHDDVIKWKHFSRFWLLVWGIRWSPVTSPHKGQWRGALMFSLICV